jgi:hypothetical protein
LDGVVALKGDMPLEGDFDFPLEGDLDVALDGDFDFALEVDLLLPLLVGDWGDASKGINTRHPIFDIGDPKAACIRLSDRIE